MKKIIVFMMFVLILPACRDKTKNIVGQDVIYKHNGSNMHGYLAFDQSKDHKRPAVLVIHEWTGLGEYIRKRTRMLAELGYVAFAMDMYGEGKIAQDHREAKKLMDKYTGDPELMLSRIRRALDILKKNSVTDPEKTAVIGYCFGGRAALKLAFSGEPVKGIVSFHGMLILPQKNEAKQIRSKLLIHHGAEDSFIPAETVKKFQDVLEKEKVDFEFISHEGAVHGFSRWSAGDDPSKGVAYNKKADKNSWASMKTFFDRIFDP